MKKLLIFILLFTSYTTFAQVKVNSEGDIIPTGIYPAVKSNNLKGTIHNFKSIAERNALPANFRDTGMIAYVTDSLKYYYLYNGITNADWRDLFNSASALTTGLTSTGDITLVDSTLTINDTIRYTIFGKDYTQVIPSVFTINSADSGYYRKDLIYADATGLHKLVGEQDTAFGVKPKLPLYSIEITTVDIYGQQIAPPTPTIITPIPNLQQVSNEGNTTTNPIIINNNSHSPSLQFNGDFNRSYYIYGKNRSSGAWGNVGLLFKNDVPDDPYNEHSGHFLQMYMGSTNSSFSKDGGLIRSNGTGGIKVALDSGKFVLGTGSPSTGNYTSRFEMGTNGDLSFLNYKNNATLDSVLATDQNGKVIMRKVSVGDIDVLQAPDSAYGDIKKLDGKHKYIVILADGTIGGSNGGSIDTISLSQRINNKWDLNGNSGTNPSTNFIGTTDNQPLIFKTNNILAGYISQISYNVSLGDNSLPYSTTPFADNSNLGHNGLRFNTTGITNSNVGAYGLFHNTTGSLNNNLGTSGLFTNTTGSFNNSLGNTSLYNNNGNYNTALGDSALYSNTTGNYEIGLGHKSGFGKTTTSNTLYISDSTYHGYWKLDSASGTAPNVIGKDANGFWHVYQTPTGSGSTYTLPTASATVLGGVKVGSGLAIDGSGVLSATGGGGGTYTASNGLTIVGSDVQLGGNLTQNTTIVDNGFDFKVQRNDASPAINVSNLSYGNAIYGSSTGDAIYGTSSSGSGIVGISTSGMAVVGRSTSGVSGFFQLSSLSNNTVSTVVDINNNGSNGTSTGFGSSIDFALRNDGSDIRLSNQIISKWTTSTDATRTSEFSITGVNNATTQTLLKISGAGVFTLVQGLTNYTDNAAAIAGGLTVGQLYRNGDTVQIVH